AETGSRKASLNLAKRANRGAKRYISRMEMQTMNSKLQSLKVFLSQPGRVALVEVAATRGSTPREAGAFMLVSASAIFGTIGGGQLEYMAIDKARQMLNGGPRSRSPANEARIEVDEVCATLDVPLGPEIGQCCGGRVEVLIRLVDASLEQQLIADAE